MADRLTGPLAAEARDHQTQRPFHADMLAKVLLRLYEQAEHEQELKITQRIGLDALRNMDA